MHSETCVVYQALLDRLETLTNRLESQAQQLQFSREEHYRQALVEAVSVLHETRQSFQSKRLKELREHLESVLKQ